MAHEVIIDDSIISVGFACRHNPEDRLKVSVADGLGVRVQIGGGVVLMAHDDVPVLQSLLAGTLKGTLHEARVRAIGFGDTVYAGGEPRLVAQSPGGGVSLIDPRDGTLCGGTTSLQSLHDDMLNGCKVYEVGE